MQKLVCLYKAEHKQAFRFRYEQNYPMLVVRVSKNPYEKLKDIKRERRVARMILDKPNRYWIYVLPSTRGVFFPHYKGKRITKEEYLQHWGKWIVLDDKEKLDVLALKLDLVVEIRWIYMIKYSRSVPEIGNLDKPTMYIFCDDRERGEILQLLSLVGVMPHGWEYEREMFEQWKPGGEFLEQWIATQGLSAEEAEKVRQESQQQDERWLEYMFGTGEEAEKLRRETPPVWTPEDMWMLPGRDKDNRE